MLIFIIFHLGISCTWTYDTAYKCQAAVSSECGPVQPGELKGISPYHILSDYTFNFNLLGLIFYTLICEEVRLWKLMQLWQKMHLTSGSG